MSALLWTAALARVQHDPDLTFLFREEIAHGALGYPAPLMQVARGQLDSTRRTRATCVPALDPAGLERELTIPDLGTLTVAAWMPPVLGHATGHVEQARTSCATAGRCNKGGRAPGGARSASKTGRNPWPAPGGWSYEWNQHRCAATPTSRTGA